MRKGNILILGARGMIGRKMVVKLEEERKVFALDKHKIDLENDDSERHLKEYMQNHQIEMTIILAAVKRQDGDTSGIFDINNKITTNICKAIKETGISVVYFSSCAVYGEKNNQFEYNESSMINPTSRYGEHKVISEMMYKSVCENDKLLIIRPPLIYSWEQQEGYQPGGFMKQAKEGTINLWGDGKEVREFIHIDDAVDITNNLIEKRVTGTYNLTSGASYSYESIAKDISSKIDCKIYNKERSISKTVNHTYDNEKLRKTIGEYNFIKPYLSKRNAN